MKAISGARSIRSLLSRSGAAQVRGALKPKRIARAVSFAVNDWRNRLPDRERKVVRISEPLLLVTQIQRSGGTLLAQLLDGHPQSLAYPNELMWGRPHKWNWPDLSDRLDDPRKAFDYLREPDMRFLYQYVSRGYGKYATDGAGDERERYPFHFNLSMQRRIFESGFPEAAGSRRRILDLYMTSFFNAWLDCQSLYGPRRFITAFTPRLNMHRESVDGFFDDYPDGWLVGLVRHPANWWASARHHGAGVYRDMGIERALTLWAESARESLDLSSGGYRAIVYRFEDLVTETETVMRDLCARTNLSWSDTLLRPTFNTIPVASDSSFESRKGVDRTVIDRWRTKLNEEETAVAERYTELYDAVATASRLIGPPAHDQLP